VIAGSLLLILGAVVMLAFGLVEGSNAYLVTSIVASLLAAIAIVAGSRRVGSPLTRTNGRPARERVGVDRNVRRTPADQSGHRHSGRDLTEVIPPVPAEVDDAGALEQTSGRRTMVVTQEPAIPAQGGSPDRGSPDRGGLPDFGGDQTGNTILDDDQDDFDDDEFDDEPADEPMAQQVSAADAARVARMRHEVLVVDGRPRYHLIGCAHLQDRESEPLPVHEAVELGFTPCGLCEPDSALLAESRRV
jgi:hypothetical protein